MSFQNQSYLTQHLLVSFSYLLLRLVYQIDLSVGLNDKAEFACEVADEALEGVWMRNGKKVSEGDRVKIVSDGKSRKLLIEQVSAEDQGEYEFRVEGSETLRLTASLSMKESELNNNVVNVTIEKPKGTVSPSSL